MSAPVPARFSLSQLSPSKVLLVVLTGLVPAVLILLSPLPFWIRVWLWAPVLGVSVALTFGRVGGRPIFSLLAAAWAYARRQRKHVWSVRQREDQRRVVAQMSRQQGHTSSFKQRLLEGAIAYGVTTGIALSFALVLIVGMRWAIVSIFNPPDTVYPVYTAAEVTSTATPSPRPTVAPTSLPPTSTPFPTPTPAPTPTPIPRTTWVFQEREWDVLVQSGSLVLGNTATRTCEVELTAPGWAYEVSIPDLETGKLLAIPALFPQANGGSLTVSSPCSDLRVELIPYRPYHPQRSQLWFVPVCIYNPHSRVRVHPSGPVEVAVLDQEGEQTDIIPAVSRAGETIWGPQPPAGSCWLYRIVSSQNVWVEVLTYR